MSQAASAAAFDLDAAVRDIIQWVEIESPTSDKGAVNRMLDRVVQDFTGLPVTIERTKGAGAYADIVTVRSAGAGERPGILLLSHVDTVHPIGTLATALPGATATCSTGPASST